MKKALRRLTIHNFQSHEDTTLELHPGVNIIVGASDVGKTSVIRALRWLYYNQPRGTGFIRLGTNECWVEAETEDGIIVRRYRNESTRKNGYLLQMPGEEPIIFEKHGQTVPEEIRAALGVEEVLIDQDVVLNLNIAYQLEGAFLLEAAGSTRAKAIGRLGDAHIVDAAQREIQKDLRSLGQEIDSKRQQLAAENKSRAQYEHLNEWDEILKNIRMIMSQRDQLEAQQQLLSGLEQRYSRNLAQKRELEAIFEQVAGVNEAEQLLGTLQYRLSQATKLTSWQQQNQIKRDAYRQHRRTLEQTHKLSQAEELTSHIKKLQFQLQTYTEIMQKLRTTQAELSRADRIITVTEKLEEAAGCLDSAHSKRIKAINLNQSLRDYQTKQSSYKKALQQLAATEQLEASERLIKKLSLLREQGAALNHQNRSYQQRRERMAATTRQLGALAGTENAEQHYQRLQILAQKIQLLLSYGEKKQQIAQTLLTCQQTLTDLKKEYQRDVEQYLLCLQAIGECPVCHGNIDDEHLKELKVQLEEDFA